MLEDVVGVVPFDAVLAALVIELGFPLVLVLALEIAAILVCASGVVVLVTAGVDVVVVDSVDDTGGSLDTGMGVDTAA